MWNNYKEEKKFKDNFKKLAKEYKKYGMTDEQIKEIYLFDRKTYLSDRKYYSRIPNNNEIYMEDIQNDLLYIHGIEGTVDSYNCETDPLLNGISDERLIRIISSASPKSRQIIKYILDGLSFAEIGRKLNVSRQNIEKCVKNLRKLNFQG